MPDRIVVYSNGIADHQRTFTIAPGDPRAVSLPVRRDHLADVLASLNVFGDVELVAPPSFEPSDVDAGNLDLHPGDALETLATNLAGSRVVVERASGTVRGTLLGLHREPEGTAGDPIRPASLVVRTEQGLRQLPLRDVTSLEFEDDAVRDELDKALARSFQRIKPQSTFVEFELAAKGAEAEAIVQFTLPAAAWKMTYRLRETDDGKYDLQGFAVVTNDTDDDWRNVLVSVVTGEPITFSTDLAQTKIPRRRHVDVVRGEALGNVEVEAVESMLQEFDDDSGVYDMADAKFGMTASASLSKVRRMAPAMAQSAAMPEATAKDVGDFCVFESTTPVTIAARRAAVIPMFLATLDESRTVLHYKLANHPERPFRAVDFTNRTTYSVGRGVCTVFQAGTYAGNCVLPAMKPGENRLLPHALESGVHIRREVKPTQQAIVALHISEGIVRTSENQRSEYVHHVRSHRDEPYRLVLDHDRALGRGSDCEATLRRTDGDEPLPQSSMRDDGPRYDVELRPRDDVAIRIVETCVVRSSIRLVGRGAINVGWLQDNIVATYGPLANHPGIRACLEIQERLDVKRREIDEAGKRTEQLAARQERLRENVRAAGEGEQAARWRVDLARTEDQITEIEERTLPGLHAERDDIEAELRTALESLAAEWSA